MSFSPEQVHFLAAHRDDITAIAGELELSKKSVISDRQRLETHFGDQSRAVMELISAQRTLAPKLHDPTVAGAWLTDADAAQQATPAAVAAVRAQRIADAGASLVHDVTCSIGTEATAVVERGLDWLGTDINLSRLLMAQHNLATLRAASVAQADALHPVTTPASSAGPTQRVCSGSGPGRVIVADPARRADGRRITDPAKLIPPLPDLLSAYPHAAMAIKCAPGIDYSEWDGLVSLVSVHGAVKEACLYTPGLSTPHGARREAVVIHQDATERVTDLGGDEVAVDTPGRFIIEPDGAIVRAGLVRHWAARHGLWMLDPHIAFLTGEAIPPHCSGFPFIEQVPLKKLRVALNAHGAGSLEILVRGVDIDPDQLRAKLKLKGRAPMAVVIARIGDSATAFVCGPRQR